jgi:hypothetical protein
MKSEFRRPGLEAIRPDYNPGWAAAILEFELRASLGFRISALGFPALIGQIAGVDTAPEGRAA